jgi:hypothetical protein
MYFRTVTVILPYFGRSDQDGGKEHEPGNRIKRENRVETEFYHVGSTSRPKEVSLTAHDVTISCARPSLVNKSPPVALKSRESQELLKVTFHTLSRVQTSVDSYFGASSFIPAPWSHFRGYGDRSFSGGSASFPALLNLSPQPQHPRSGLENPKPSIN